MPEDLVMSLKYHNKEIFAKAAADTLVEAALSSPKSEVGKRIIHTHRELSEESKDNILVKNYMDFVLHGVTSANYKHKLNERRAGLDKETTNGKSHIYHNIKMKSALGKNIFVHSLNADLIHVVKENTHKKSFEVFSPKHKDLYKQRHALDGQKVKFIGDLDLFENILSSDICIFGADLLQKGSAIAKKGTNMCLEIARAYHKPTYLCSSVFYYDPQDKHRPEDYDRHYEQVSPENFTGIISELGIHKPANFMHEAHHHHPWLDTKSF